MSEEDARAAACWRELMEAFDWESESEVKPDDVVEFLYALVNRTWVRRTNGGVS